MALADAPFPPNTIPPTPAETAIREQQAATRALGRCGSLQTSTGMPCRRFPRAGYTVCPRHGERAPQTVGKAERLLAVARMPAIEWILDALDQAGMEPCEACGYPVHGSKERKRLDTLAFKLLDRTGFGPRSTIDVNATRNEAGIDVSLLNAGELEELDRLLDAMDAFKSRVRIRNAREGARGIIDADSSGVPAVALLQSALADADRT